jgi:hypothetical protein
MLFVPLLVIYVNKNAVDRVAGRGRGIIQQQQRLIGWEGAASGGSSGSTSSRKMDFLHPRISKYILLIT